MYGRSLNCVWIREERERGGRERGVGGEREKERERDISLF